MSRHFFAYRTCGLVLLIALLLSACAVRRGVIHKVKEGQTLWRISRVYNVKINTLLEVNDIDDPRTVRPGTEIVIPGAEGRETVPSTPSRVAQNSDDRNNTKSRSSSDEVNNERSTRIPPDSSLPEQESTNETKGGSDRDQESPNDKEKSDPSNYFDPVWPCEGQLASRFDKNGGPTQRGIRIHSEQGGLVKAAEEGNIKLAGSWEKMPQLGKIVIVFHSHDFTTVYAHLDDVRISEGESVSRGDIIGEVGRSGDVDRAMCYFEVRYNLEPRDPLIFLGERP